MSRIADPEIREGVAWTEPVDEVFRENADDVIGWQYFAAKAGFTRLYPATRWSIRQLGEVSGN